MLHAPHQDMTRELINASREGNLARVGELLQISAVRDNAAAYGNAALLRAADNGHLAVVDRLLKIQAVIDNVAINDNDVLREAARNGHLAVVNRLLEITAVRDNAAIYDNDILRWALDFDRLEVACSLLSVHTVRAHLENGSRETFLEYFQRILSIIYRRMPHIDDAYGYDNNQRKPLDTEIEIVNILRDIGHRHGITAADFTNKELFTLVIARRTEISLFSALLAHPLLTAMLAAPAPQEEPHPLFDPAAPAPSSGTPALADDEASNDEPGPSESSSSRSRKRARPG